jgi:iron complex outermembrane recepter protein
LGKTSTTRAQSTGLALRKNPLALACAAAFLLAGNAAYAQSTTPPADTAPAPATTTVESDDSHLTPEQKEAKLRASQVKKLESVKVVGIRVGIENAIETKQENSSIVESISAEDIGKLPDSSIAESIARLPGLTAQRERGRATQINIRGFAGDFAGTTLNGREQVSTGENRGVEFDQYPSELMSSVVVYKTPDASLVGQGLSGTVDLRTVRPLDFEKRVVSANYRADMNENNGLKVYGNRYSFAYIDQFDEGRVGISIGYAHLDSPNPGFQNESWGYADGPNGTKVSGGGKVYQFTGPNERDGWMGTLQFKPNDFYEGTVDLLYSTYNKNEEKFGMEFGTQWGSNPGPSIQPGYTVGGNNTITSSDWTNVRPVLRMDSNPINDELGSFGFNNIFHINDDWDLTADYSYSFVNRNMRFLETYAGLTTGQAPGFPNLGGVTTLGYDLDPSGHFLNLSFGTDLNNPSNLELIDAGGWGQDGYLKDFRFVDKLHSFRVDAERHFDSETFSSLEFGINYSTRTKFKTADERKLCIVSCANVGDSAPFPGSPSSFGVAGIDGLAFFSANDLYQSGFYNEVQNLHPDIAKKNWEIEEDLTTYYAQLNIDAVVFDDMPLKGNIGFQYVVADQQSTGYQTFPNNAVGNAVVGGDKYGDFLPSLNLNLGLPWNSYVRFAAARQMARPRLDDLRANFDVGATMSGTCGEFVAPTWCGSAGNPNLRPWLANAYDLSLEKYFTTEAGNKGYASAAYFFKDLSTYIYKDRIPYDFAGLPLPTVPAGIYPPGTAGSVEMPFNGEGGILKGLELSISAPLDFIWSGLNGFGIQASYSDTKSSISPNGPGTSEPLPGLSKYVSNITAYYEHSGFSIRFSQRSRSAFRAETRGGSTPGADLQFIDIQGETVQDAQLNYSFQPGNMFEGLSLYLQMSNIGDEPFRTADGGDPELRPIQFFEYGKTTLLGFSSKV